MRASPAPLAIVSIAALAASLAARPAGASKDDGPPVLPIPVELPDSTHPKVQWTLTVDVGGGFAAREGTKAGMEGILHFGGHSLVMFGRHRGKGVGGGVCLDAGTRDFDSFVGGAGVALLIPFGGFLPLVIEVWPHWEWYRGNSGGFTMRLWWGLHARNYLKSHVPTMGLYIQASRSWGEPDAERWILVAGIDLSLLIPMLPLMSLVNLAFR